CQIYGFLGGLTGTVSISTLAAIAIDRYFVIIYPLDPLKRTTRLRAGICVFVSWLYGAVFSSLPLLGINHYVPEGYLTSCGFDYLSTEFSSRIFIIVFFVAAWVVPFIIITFSYVNICLMVVSARQGGARNATGFREQQKKTELKLTIVVIGIIGLWFLAWTPYATVALLGFFGQKHLIMPLTSMIPALFCKIASCVDPFVYAVSHPRFRRELIRCFSRKAYANTEKLYKSKATTAMAGIEMRRAIQRDLLSDASNTEEDNENMMM
ncbi:Ultraviolet opsin Rh7-like 2, partial [Ephemera danica]